jgi:hypothetical protein
MTETFRTNIVTQNIYGYGKSFGKDKKKLAVGMILQRDCLKEKID